MRIRTALSRGGALLLTLASSLAMAEQLPVYNLGTAEVSEARGAAVLYSVYGGQPPAKPETRETNTTLVMSIGDSQLEIEKASGGIFLRDARQLWNAALKPTLPDPEKARQIADEFLKSAHLLPERDKFVVAQFESFAGTSVSPDTGDTRDQIALDVQVNYSVKLNVVRETGAQEQVPIVGGGGDFKVAVGDAGRIIGYTGVWRPITGVASMADVIPQKEAEEQYLKSLGVMKVTKLSSSLAYYSAPSFERQALLTPVWVMRGEADVDGNRVPLRVGMVAATKYGPTWRGRGCRRAKTGRSRRRMTATKGLEGTVPCLICSSHPRTPRIRSKQARHGSGRARGWAAVR